MDDINGDSIVDLNAIMIAYKNFSGICGGGETVIQFQITNVKCKIRDMRRESTNIN